MAEEGKDNIEVDAESPIANEPQAKSAGLIAQLISILRKFTIGQEMTSNSITMPEGFEAKDTGLERFQLGTLKHSDILVQANEIEDPVLRMIQVLKWVFTLGQVFQSKKPLNPVLGEVSVCKFYSNQPKDGNKNNGKHTKGDVDEDVFYSISEQVSHHPPKSAYIAENKKQGISISGFSQASIKFLGTAIKLAIEGKTDVSFAKFNEVYTYSPPAVMIRFVGFVLEYAGDIEISCSGHPYVARITYKEKPYLRGKYHHLKGRIVKINKEKEGKEAKKEEEVVVKFKGHWNNEVVFDDLRNNKKYTFSTVDYPPTAGIPVYPPLADDLPQSSRKVWQGVKNSTDSFAKAKKEVEEEQRRKAKERAEKGEEHVPKFFSAEEIEGKEIWKANPDVLQTVVF